MLPSMIYSLPELLDLALNAKLAAMRSSNIVSRIWAKDASVWTNADESKWLAWLTIADEELAHLEKYRELAADIERADFKDVLLMGMGGSSLCPEVLALTFNRSNFHILDSTVPSQVQTVESKIDIAKTLFIVASKSGSTLEPNCFKQYFFDRVAQTVGKENAGKHFVAITDPGSKMEAAAKSDGFRHIFYGKPEIGGRYSALSAFGLTAAAAMGLDVERLLRPGSEMGGACRNEDPQSNPGLVLGTILGICHGIGRDKLTIFTSPEIHDLGAWLEQLIAESTGKNGVAIIPVDREPIQPAVSYGDDRVFVNLKFNGSDSGPDLSELFAAGHPVIEISINDLYDLGAEFFRWEFATAVAGSIMQINPFDQPDVESAKIEARKITDEYERTGSLSEETPFFESNGIQLFTSEQHANRLRQMVDERGIVEFLSAHLATIEEHDYFGMLAYVEMNSGNESTLQDLRRRVLEKYLPATCLGFGPRFLHSTGQAYKGGPNTGVFLQITSEDETELSIPGQKYTFGVVNTAQARGDFQVLLDRGRRALRIHFSKDADFGFDYLTELV
ncbi:MAG: transaldolase [Acidobacteria bacterium]|nr:MAG: transaldolase [Acidobacteriota bacterium]